MPDAPVHSLTLVIAGTGSGVGKTSLTLALCAALARRSLRVQPFKVGPDFLDPTYLTLAAGRTCYNLDGWMCGAESVRALVAAKGAAADVVLIEGVMGMYDGAAPDSPAGSTAEIAAWLNAPVVLVVNAHGAARSVAAMVKGFATLDRTPGVAAVIANQCGSETHVAWLERALAAAALPGLVGAVPRGALPELKSRHLGLVTADGSAVLPGTVLTELAAAAEKHLNLDKLLALDSPARSHAAPRRPTSAARPSKASLRIGVARDRAFHFYYAANLEALQAAGAELVEFSPLTDTALPANLAGLYIGGGYPEEFAAELAGNTAMRTAIAQFAAAGGAIYAECGGLMYLAQAAISRDGESFPMCGVLPCTTRMLKKLRRLGYAEVTTTAASVWGPAGTVVRGHEFHYSEIVPEQEAGLAAAGWQRGYRLRYGRDGQTVAEGFSRDRILASYVHAYFADRPHLAAAFVQFCRGTVRQPVSAATGTPDTLVGDQPSAPGASSALKTGFTTGTCAAAATQAAARVLAGETTPEAVLVALPDASAAPLRVPVAWARVLAPGNAAEAAVQKDAGSDPDVTHGSLVQIRLEAVSAGTPVPAPNGVRFMAGDGVGVVTKAGLQVPPGEPAINPVPRRMMEHALRTVLPTGAWQLTVSVPGGRELAEKTFNPRLGIVGGISILGTTGIVRPFSHQALQAALRCALEVAAAAGAVPVVLVPGNIGRRAVHARFAELRDEQVVEVGNEWGFILDACRRRPVFTQWLLAGHPGKLAKFLEQDWDTHSSRSRSALEPLLTVAAELKLASGQIAEATTAEGVFAALSETDRRRLGDALARRIRDAVQAAYQPAATIGVWLCDMKGRELGFVPADARPAAQCTNPVVIAGCGPGAPDCVTPAAREAVMRAELLVGAPKVLALFPDAPGQRFEVHDAMGPGLDAAAVAQAAGRRVCVLVTGDPGVFSLATLVVKRLGAANCRLIPGISSVQVACARLGVPWARAKLISAHAALPAHTEQAALAQEEVVVLFGGKEQSWEWIAQAAEALRSSHQAWLCENLTLPSERVLLWPATPTPAAPGLVVLIRRENP